MIGMIAFQRLRARAFQYFEAYGANVDVRWGLRGGFTSPPPLPIHTFPHRHHFPKLWVPNHLHQINLRVAKTQTRLRLASSFPTPSALAQRLLEPPPFLCTHRWSAAGKKSTVRSLGRSGNKPLRSQQRPPPAPHSAAPILPPAANALSRKHDVPSGCSTADILEGLCRPCPFSPGQSRGRPCPFSSSIQHEDTTQQLPQ